ncbi:hypothetical protein LINPERPRIM_LOCUS37509 [Linum perenne]
MPSLIASVPEPPSDMPKPPSGRQSRQRVQAVRGGAAALRVPQMHSYLEVHGAVLVGRRGSVQVHQAVRLRRRETISF